jgi:hypothetical protein
MDVVVVDIDVIGHVGTAQHHRLDPHRP